MRAHASQLACEAYVLKSCPTLSHVCCGQFLEPRGRLCRLLNMCGWPPRGLRALPTSAPGSIAGKKTGCVNLIEILCVGLPQFVRSHSSFAEAQIVQVSPTHCLNTRVQFDNLTMPTGLRSNPAVLWRPQLANLAWQLEGPGSCNRTT